MHGKIVCNVPLLSLCKLPSHTKNKWLLLLTLFIAYCLFAGDEVRLSPNHFWQKRFMPAVNIDDVMLYVINLDRTPERYAAVKASLDRAGLKHQRFSAVDGYLLQMIDEKGQYFTGADVKNGTYRFVLEHKYIIKCPSGDITYMPNKHFKKLLTAGELGVLCSHRGIWQDILKNKHKNAIIFEDDIAVNSQFHRLFQIALGNLPINYDLLFMIYEVNENSHKITHIINNDYILKVLANKQPIWYLAAYMLSDSGAYKLFNNINFYDRPVDHMVGKFIANNIINSYTVADQKYAILQEDNNSSTITNMGRK